MCVDSDDPHMVRYMERGASIVAVVPAIDRPRVIVQMPRGNLETVYPRALTLYSINHSLSRRDYARAFLTARADRIDLNLLYDHNPTDFLSHVDEFVSQLASEDYLNLFLSDLNNTDTTKTKYPRYTPLPPIDVAAANASSNALAATGAAPSGPRGGARSDDGSIGSGAAGDVKAVGGRDAQQHAVLAAKLKETERHPLDDRTG